MSTNLKTFASLFTGGDLAGVGAGLSTLWGVESIPEIADVAELSGTPVIRARVEDVDYSKLESPDWLHMSPVCVNASQAKQDAGETQADIDSANACARAIRELRSPVVSLENVWQYRNFAAFQIICNELAAQGYHVRFWHLNAANYGVPQTRKRLILLASLNFIPEKPRPTHSKTKKFGLFDHLPKWIGWYEAIEDLIPTLPESKFADWQLKRLPQEYAGSLLCMTGNTSDEQAAEGVGILTPDQPANSVYAQPPSIRAFIVEGTAAGEGNKFTLPVRKRGEPIFTVRGGNMPRAWLSQGRIVSMTPRALARFQSIPDSYLLPEKNSLACRIIGNAVPCLLMRRIVESVKEQILRRAA